MRVKLKNIIAGEDDQENGSTGWRSTKERVSRQGKDSMWRQTATSGNIGNPSAMPIP